MTVEERGTDVLDLLLVIAENVRLLVLGPVVIGFLAWGLAHFLPPSYHSQAILVLPPPSPTLSIILTQPMQTPIQAASLMMSPLVLDQVIESLQLSQGRSIQATREALTRNIKPVVGKDGLLTLDVVASTAVLAQSICAAVVDIWLTTTVPGPQDRAYLEQRLTYEKAALESVTALINRLGTDGVSNLSKPLTRGEAGVTLLGLAELQERYLNAVLVIPRVLQGYTRDVLKQGVTLAEELTRPTKTVVGFMSATVMAVALLFFVLIRHSWKRAAKDPAVAVKQSRVVQALRFWRR